MADPLHLYKDNNNACRHISTLSFVYPSFHERIYNILRKGIEKISSQYTDIYYGAYILSAVHQKRR